VTEPIPLVDFEALRRHVAAYDNLFLMLLNLFLEQAPAWVAELTEAVASGDALLVRQVCHKIKGGAGTLHAKAIIAATEELSRHAVAGDFVQARASCERLLSVIEQTTAVVRSFKGVGTGGGQGDRAR